MVRIDIPTLQCDRCKRVTTDDMEMYVFRGVHWYTGDSGNTKNERDWCPDCWADFEAFDLNMNARARPRGTRVEPECICPQFRGVSYPNDPLCPIHDVKRNP